MIRSVACLVVLPVLALGALPGPSEAVQRTVVAEEFTQVG